MKDYERRAEEIIASRGAVGEGERLHRLFDLQWQYTMEEYPEFATYVGWPGQNHRWTDVSLEAIEQRESGRGLALVRDLTREWQGHLVVRAEEPPWKKAVGACFPAPPT